MSTMIQGLSTPVNMKLQLIPVLQHMHHDTTTAAMVRILCTQLLNNYPAARDFTLVILNTLTELSLATLVDIPSQVSLVLDAGYSDIETGIIKLAKRPQCWTNPTIDRLVEIIQTLPPRKIPALLHVLVILTRSPAIVHAHHDRGSKLMTLVHDLALSCDLLIAVKSVQIITNIVSYCYKEGLPVSSESIFVVEALLLVLTVSDTTTPYILKTALKCSVSLCQSNLSLCSQFVDLIGNQMLNEANSHSGLLCEALAAIGNLEPQVLKTFQPSILKKLNHAHYNQSKTMLYTLLFQIHAGQNFSQAEWLQYVAPLNSIHLWDIYRVARSAARYGHHNICLYILNKISNKICSENLYFWLIRRVLSDVSAVKALKQIVPAHNDFFTAEFLLSFQIGGTHQIHISASLIDQGDKTWHTGPRHTLTVKVHDDPHYTTRAGVEGVIEKMSQVRHFRSIKNVRIHLNSQLLLRSVHDMSKYTITNRQDISGCQNHPTPGFLLSCLPSLFAFGTIGPQHLQIHLSNFFLKKLRKRSVEFHNLVECYDRLYELCFDLDNSSLLNINILKYMSALLEYSINMIVSTNNQFTEQPLLDIEQDSLSLEHKIMIKFCNEILRLTKLNSSGMPKVITHKY
ncbi:integrator complex subunit 7-like [Diaphorina citri]|uniref:Integrator complex subunit 7 n=1 Tax=Diaphorina citri TaxID=121845 RepID=A0A3Q0J225_DIACI|nr:integrator complex subunit 7-like [Diaphorina citri]